MHARLIYRDDKLVRKEVDNDLKLEKKYIKLYLEVIDIHNQREKEIGELEKLNSDHMVVEVVCMLKRVQNRDMRKVVRLQIMVVETHLKEAPLFPSFEGKLRIFDRDTRPNYNHVLDILHKSYKRNDNRKIHTVFSVPTSYTAVELAKAGVNFKPNQNKPGALTIEFQSSTCNPTLTMPVLRIEEYCRYDPGIVPTYEQSFPDVDHPSGHQYIADMIQGLCQEVVLKDFSYGQSWRKIDEYCNSGLGWIRPYFTGTWSFIASVSALILFLLTAIQTYCSIRSL
uniref:Uncharacterized protein n=1 Tax=Tanacetum cinerariifolium TaxID=118510 RepID=A0A6L2M5U2_TANCI|nr:hypothetical protein [Tanacetum cinerariifolium]